MSIKYRIAKLERHQPDEQPCLFLDEEGLVEWFAENLRHFGKEPDSRRALELARETVSCARLSTDPPWIPPDLEVGAPIEVPHNSRVIRLNLHRSYRFPEAHEAVEWIREMARRLGHGIPPVSEAQYLELAMWFEGNAERLDGIAKTLPNGLIDVGKIGDDWHATKVCSSEVRFQLQYGPRAENSGKTAETIRRLRAKYPEQVAHEPTKSISPA